MQKEVILKSTLQITMPCVMEGPGLGVTSLEVSTWTEATCKDFGFLKEIPQSQVEVKEKERPNLLTSKEWFPPILDHLLSILAEMIMSFKEELFPESSWGPLWWFLIPQCSQRTFCGAQGR